MSERTKVVVALAISALLHLIGCVVLAGWLTISAERPKVAVQKPKLEVVLMKTRPLPPTDAVPRVIGSEGLQPSSKPPVSPVFESDKDMRAASELPASGNLPLPTQKGSDRKQPGFTDQNYSLGRTPEQPTAATPPQPEAARPTQQQAPQEAVRPVDPAPALPQLSSASRPAQTPSPQPSAAPKAAEPKKSELETMKAQPETKKAASPGYQPQIERTRIEGSISNRGKNSVDAVATPMGRYRKLLAEAIGSRWYYYVNRRMDLITLGDVHIKFRVDESGVVHNLKMMSNTANETFGIYCVQSVTEAKIPPLPPDIAAKLENRQLEIDYHFTIYPK